MVTLCEFVQCVCVRRNNDAVSSAKRRRCQFLPNAREEKCDKIETCVRSSFQSVAEPEKQVTQTKTQETAYCETTNQTSKSWNETC